LIYRITSTTAGTRGGELRRRATAWWRRAQAHARAPHAAFAPSLLRDHIPLPARTGKALLWLRTGSAGQATSGQDGDGSLRCSATALNPAAKDAKPELRKAT
jgi:hypothetical protein